MKELFQKQSNLPSNDQKIHVTVMHERLNLCMQEQDLYRRLRMYEKLKTQVERASVPYIDFLIRKTHKKIEDHNV